MFRGHSNDCDHGDDMVVEMHSVVSFFKNTTFYGCFDIQIQNHALSLLLAPLLHMYVFKAEQTFQQTKDHVLPKYLRFSTELHCQQHGNEDCRMLTCFIS